MKRSQGLRPLWSLAFMLSGLVLPQSASWATPSQITFSNETDIAIGTSVAGLPGHGIAPSVTKPVPYDIVALGCNYSGQLTNCPIEFTDKRSGALIAKVMINAQNASLNAPPVFFGDYGERFTVTGWETTPLNHITISQKA